MLVLSRREGEEILLDNSIRVRVVKLSGDRVKLAFEAPREVTIHRGEIAAALDADAAQLRVEAVV